MVSVRDSMNGVHEGATFGKWTVLGPCFKADRWSVVARCECGRTSVASVQHLKDGTSTRCQHCRYCGKYIKRIRHIWSGMIKRCYNPKASRYSHYGARGIGVCDEWRNSQDAFVSWSLKNGYQETLEIEREDNDGDYSPINCRWATRKEQTRNTRVTRFEVAFGETKCLSAWAEDERCIVPVSAFLDRIYRGWSVERAMVSPPLERITAVSAFGEVKTVAEWSTDSRCRVSQRVLRNRLVRGWNAERAIADPRKFERVRQVA